MKPLYFLFKNLPLHVLHFHSRSYCAMICLMPNIPTRRNLQGGQIPRPSIMRHSTGLGHDKKHTQHNLQSPRASHWSGNWTASRAAEREGGECGFVLRAAADHPPRFAFQSISRWFSGVDQRDFHPCVPKRRRGARRISTGRLGQSCFAQTLRLRLDDVFNLEKEHVALLSVFYGRHLNFYFAATPKFPKDFHLS